MGLLRKRLPGTKTLPIAARWRTVGPGASARRPVQVEKPPPCRVGCPVGNDVRGAMAVVARHTALGLSETRALDEAWRMLVVTNPFPAVLGRVCPHPCERHCNRGEKDEAVSIAAFERFVGDWGIDRGLDLPESAPPGSSAKSVAIVGAGPGGLSCAFQLASRGHAVTVYERHPLPGGMLRYGVPCYRLSRSVLDAELGRLLKLGIVLRCGVQVGTSIALGALQHSHDAVFVAIGAHQGRPLNVEGEQGVDVLSGIEFLTRVNSAEPPALDGHVGVVGDGPTAVDVARVANRLGRATPHNGVSVTLVRAHSRAEEDLGELEEEGVQVLYESTPVAIERGEAGQVVALETQRARLGEPDREGLRLPVALGEPSAVVPVSMLVASVSQVPDWKGLGLLEGERSLAVDESGRTPLNNVWSGGDSVALGTVAESIGQGLRAARAMDAHLRGAPAPEAPGRRPVGTGRVKLALYDVRTRSSRHRLTSRESLHNLAAEIDQGITRPQAIYEAGRCLGCGACIGCERCWMYCTPGCFTRSREPSACGPSFSASLSSCDGCGKCADECPSGFVEMH